jgi:arginyl-tRNA synthetase
MNKNKIALSSLAMDLKRVALSYHNGSVETARRFFEEAIKRRDEVDKKKVRVYLREILNNLDRLILQKDRQKIAEDALMYSTLFQNAAF